MLAELLNKLLTVMFFASCLNTLRHAYYFIQAWYTPSSEDEPTKYRLKNSSLLVLGISIAYILTVIFTGIKL
jgi:hypothetical protein